MMSAQFKRRELTAISELANRKIEYETFKALRLQKIIAERQIAIDTFNADSPQNIDGYFCIDETEYNLSTFDELLIGNETAENESEFLMISRVKFYFCTFSACCFTNVKFTECRFIGCTFSECFTMNYGIYFEDCRFSSNDPIKKSVDDMFSYFRLCELTAKFIHCEMKENIFSKTNFYFTEFNDDDMADIIVADCGFEMASLSDCNLNNAKIVTSKFIDFSFKDTYVGTRVNRNTFFGALHCKCSDNRELLFAIDMYFSLSELFQENKIADLYGEYFFLYKKVEMQTLKGMSKVQSFLSFIVCGYGERPFYSLINSLVLIFLCGNLYYFFGLATIGTHIKYDPSLPVGEIIKALFECYHFSLVTFTTVGYGNIYPYGISYIVNGFEMIFAVLLVGIWVSTLVRKMVR